MEENEEYDRMNPDWYALLVRLEDYSKLTYGAPAYSLSVAEAKVLLDLVFENQTEKY